MGIVNSSVVKATVENPLSVVAVMCVYMVYIEAGPAALSEIQRHCLI